MIENTNDSAQAWIEKVYQKYPYTMQNNHVMVWGEGDSQQFAMFELTPSFSRRGAVEVKWFQAYPLRQGVGSRAMQELQAMAREDGISLTLYPWDKGQVSQSKLTKFYRGQGFKPAVKGSKNMAWTPELNEATLSVDVPNEGWLQDKIEYAKSKGRNSFGVPYMGSTTAYVKGTPPQVRVVKLSYIPGMRNEQHNVRRDDLNWLMDYMGRTGKLPPKGTDPNDEYLPYIMVAYNGEAWVNEGNHRIMAAYRLGWQTMPIELAYFDGGERVKDGDMYPAKIGLA
jgi:GNAT superfamily N-acetyltransferase